MYYRICPFCGAHLDPGESCDCVILACNLQDDNKMEDYDA